MMLYLLLTAAFVLLPALRVTLRLDLLHQGDTQVRLQLHTAGLRLTRSLILHRSEQGVRLLVADRHGLHPVEKGAWGSAPGRPLLRAFLHPGRGRRFALRHFSLIRLDALVLLSAADAASCALLSGLLGTVLAILPPLRRPGVRCRVLPAFFRPRTSVQLHCIIRFRLGTLILTAVLLLADHLHLQRRTESEAM